MPKKICKTIICVFIIVISFLEGENALAIKQIKNTNDLKIKRYQEKQNIDIADDEYLGILEIPKIKLKRGFYNKTSPLNNLNENIYYLKESIPLGSDASLIILAAHRGSSKVSFFNELEHLAVGDIIYLNYLKSNYQYRLSFIYNEEKDGLLNIYRDEKQDALVLITCNRQYKKYQTIYVAYRI